MHAYVFHVACHVYRHISRLKGLTAPETECSFTHLHAKVGHNADVSALNRSQRGNCLHLVTDHHCTILHLCVANCSCTLISLHGRGLCMSHNWCLGHRPPILRLGRCACCDCTSACLPPCLQAAQQRDLRCDIALLMGGDTETAPSHGAL